MKRRLVESVQALQENQGIVANAVGRLIETVRSTEQKLLLAGQDLQNFDRSGLESLQAQLYVLAIEIDNIREQGFKQLDMLSVKIEAGLNMVSDHMKTSKKNGDGMHTSALFSLCLSQLEVLRSQVEFLRYKLICSIALP